MASVTLDSELRPMSFGETSPDTLKTRSEPHSLKGCVPLLKFSGLKFQPIKKPLSGAKGESWSEIDFRNLQKLAFSLFSSHRSLLFKSLFFILGPH
jgi:hypothetical protein